MAQKTKVKELVGRGLDSYHTKALQQMDRIEKKNKEQNHKISILSNELDNDYLTKTEEGSVISLEHSKEGMVYLDELQGNTLVNYCTDGSKEMTLNGDIDVEGVSVTTTEGVDNGLVDVICEGNTLVNLFNYNNLSHNVNTHVNRIITLPHGGVCDCIFPTKTNVIYTVMLDITDLPTDIGLRVGLTDSNQWYPSVDINKSGFHKIKLENKGQAIDRLRIHELGLVAGDGKAIRVKDIMILEGDWTNKEVPPYFEGMKSVGQDDKNEHKIEILSSVGKPNLIKNSGFLNGISNYSFHNSSKGEIIDDTSSQSGKILKMTTGSNGGVSGPFQSNIVNYIEDKKYTLSGWCKGEPGTTLGIYIERHKSIDVTFTNDDWVRFVVTSEQNPTNWNRTITFYSSNVSKVFYLKDIKIEESDNDTPYIPHISEKNYNSFNGINKKEILMNEPLRGFVDGKKDRFIKIGGKWYIERNCQLKSSSQFTWLESGRQFENHYCVYVNSLGCKKDSKYLSTSYPYIADAYANRLDASYISNNSNTGYDLITLTIPKSKLTTVDINGAREYLNNNPFDFMVELATPTYEEITDAELITYLDTTHISNNSIIPCNMKIKNSGYNAIIKPSTLYTVALDTNKSGTIGMNLGGAKGTTTNNVLKLTTPATLADDSLRLYGKGIKGSKVRILEGDKTNWIPSFFEGMKSSFEDKLQDDGSYKMEILSNNKNLFDINANNNKSNGVKLEIDNNSLTLSNNDAQYTWQQCNIFIKGLQRNKTYTLSVGEVNIQNDFQDKSMFAISVYEETRNIQLSSRFDFDKKECTFTVPQGANLNKIFLRVHLTSHTPLINRIFVKDIQISEVKSDHIKRKYNKIQFSSIEPLRSLPSGVKDKFIFKDGKLMIERNTRKTKITSDMNFTRSYEGWANIVFACEVDGLIPIDISTKNVYCNVLPSFNIAELCNALGKTGIASHGWINNRCLQIAIKGIDTVDKLREWISERDMEIVYQIEPTYEEIPFELQKIILEGYENGTLFFDTNIPPTSTVTYAGETPIVKSVKLNKTEVLNNTNDINDNIIPYLMDMDYRVVCLQLQSEEFNGGVAMARLFGGAYEMLKRDILSNRYSKEEYKHRLDAYLGANKITEEEYNKLGDMLNE